MTSPAPSVSCPKCGSGIADGSRFCSHCGWSLSGEVPARPSVASAVAHEGRLSDSGALELKTLLVASTADDYDIQDELGRGGMAVVFKATEVHLRRPVAIKILPPDLTYAKGATERFQREAQTAAALDHPNIIPIYRISASGKLCWYAMKFLEGRSLGDILAEKGLLTVSETIAILEQVASALDYAHQHGVIHRDVKPGNVMLDVNGRVTVTDFGIAKELTSGALTGSGAILGTPYYMSPEQCRGGQGISGAADQYSLAVMAYQMISGQLPFDADSAIDVIHKHVSEPPPPLELLLPGLPRHVIAAINRGLAKKATERFPTVTAFVAAMRHAPDEKTLMLEARRSLIGRRRSGIDKPVTLAGSTRRVSIGLVVLGGFAIGIWYLATRFGGAADEPGLPVDRPAAAAPSPGARAGVPAAERRAADNAARTDPRSRTTRTARPPAPSRPTRSAAAPAGGQPITQSATTSPPPAAATGTGKGFVRISLDTWANITVEGLPPRQSRAFNDSVPAGTHTVTFARDGYETLTRPLRVVTGQVTTMSVTMRPTGHP